MQANGSTTGTVRDWRIEEGWGVIDSNATPGGCFAHRAQVATAGFRALEPGAAVELEWERAEQDGFGYRAVRVWPAGTEPHERASDGPSSAYRSSLTIDVDDEPGTSRSGTRPS